MEGSYDALVLDERGVLGFDFKQAVLKVEASSGGDLIQPVLLDDFVLGSGELGTHGISKERVKVTVALLHFGVVSVVEAA